MIFESAAARSLQPDISGLLDSVDQKFTYTPIPSSAKGTNLAVTFLDVPPTSILALLPNQLATFTCSALSYTDASHFAANQTERYTPPPVPHSLVPWSSGRRILLALAQMI